MTINNMGTKSKVSELSATWAAGSPDRIAPKNVLGFQTEDISLHQEKQFKERKKKKKGDYNPPPPHTQLSPEGVFLHWEG